MFNLFVIFVIIYFVLVENKFFSDNQDASECPKDAEFAEFQLVTKQIEHVC